MTVTTPTPSDPIDPIDPTRRTKNTNLLTVALVPPMLIALGFVTVRSTLSAQLVILAFLSSLVCVLPIMLRQRGSLIEPVFAVSMLVFVGVSLRLVLVASQAGTNELVRDRLLNGEDPDVLYLGAMAIFVGLACLSLGYLSNPNPMALHRTFLVRRPVWSLSRTKLAISLLAGFGLLGTVLLVQTFGLESLSAKRFNSLEGGAQARTSSVAFIYFRLGLLVRFGLYILLIFRRQVSRRFRLLIPLLFAASVFVPVYVNNRAGVGLIVIDLLLIGYLGSGRFKTAQIVRAGAFLSVSMIAILSVRGSRNSAIESTLYSRDLLDVSKTAQIMELEPGVLSGQSLYGWVLAQLPIESEAGLVWSNMGRYVWTFAYEKPGQNGVPPGFVGELYLAFGWPAIIVGTFLFGIALRKLYVTFRPHLTIPGVGLLYALTLPRLTIFTLSNDFGTGILKTAADAVPILFFLWFVGVRENTERTGALTQPVDAQQLSARSGQRLPR